jgi:hypothetical protein
LALDLLTLLLPAAVVMMALPFGLRARSGRRSVRAVYLFHRSGDPLAMVASNYVPPFQAEQLEPVLGAVRDFVETSVPKTRGYRQTSMRFGEEGLVAVRGRYVSACAVYRGHREGPLRRDLVRVVRDFEDGNSGSLETWEGATTLADSASSAISGLMERPAGTAA